MEIDDNLRGKLGVVCSVREMDNKVRISLDDVTNKSQGGLGNWEHDGVVTWKEYESSEFDNMDISEKEFADFGHYVFARLVALKKEQSKK